MGESGVEGVLEEFGVRTAVVMISATDPMVRRM